MLDADEFEMRFDMLDQSILKLFDSFHLNIAEQSPAVLNLVPVPSVIFAFWGFFSRRDLFLDQLLIHDDSFFQNIKIGDLEIPVAVGKAIHFFEILCPGSSFCYRQCM